MTKEDLKKPSVVFKLLKTYEDGELYIWNGMTVIRTLEKKPDGKVWLHVSCARQKKLPSYAELQLVRREFIGEEMTSIMIFPPKDRYVNICKTCLHLWTTEDMQIPEMSEMMGELRSI